MQDNIEQERAAREQKLQSGIDLTNKTREIYNNQTLRHDSEPAIVPSVLFDQETVDKMNWKTVFGF